MYSMPSAQNLQTFRRRKNTFLRMARLLRHVLGGADGTDADGLGGGNGLLALADRPTQVLVGAQRQVAQHPLVLVEALLHLLERRRDVLSDDVEEHVAALVELADRIGELALAPALFAG